MSLQIVDDPIILDSTGQLIKSALLQIKDAVQPTNVGVDMPLSIPVSAWPNSAPYEFTWLSTKVTPECVVSVGYGEGAENIDTLYLYATKVAGGVKFTTPEKPVTAIPVVIHILNAAAESITAVDADMVATDAVNGASNVDQALSVLDDTKQNKTDNSLATTSKTVVGAINEHDTEIGDLTNLATTEKGSLVGAANELKDTITALNSNLANKANKIQTMIVEGTTDADGDIVIGLSTESYALISCSPDRNTPGYYTSWYAIIPYGATNSNLYSAKCISDNVQRLSSTAVRFKVNYIQI